MQSHCARWCGSSRERAEMLPCFDWKLGNRYNHKSLDSFEVARDMFLALLF